MEHTDDWEELPELDDLDLEILEILGENCRISNREIAKILGKSPVTIGRHIEDLEQKGVIKNWGAHIDYEKLGYDIIAYIEITIAKGKLLEVEREIAKHPNVFGVYDITGTYDAVVLAMFKTRRELSRIIKQILASEYVERTNTHLVLNIIKDNSSLRALKERENRRHRK